MTQAGSRRVQYLRLGIIAGTVILLVACGVCAIEAGRLATDVYRLLRRTTTPVHPTSAGEPTRVTHLPATAAPADPPNPSKARAYTPTPTRACPTVVCEPTTVIYLPVTVVYIVPEPSATETCTPTPTEPSPSRTPAGAVIKLHAILAGCCGAGAPLPTVIQRQDDDGTWHDVDSWQGPLDENGEMQWWVSEEECGQGPFRWVVWDQCGCSVLAVSEPFHLPEQPGEVLVVEVRQQP